MTARMLQEIELVIGEVRPDLVLVYGDTNSTVAAALAAAKMRVPVAHVRPACARLIEACRRKSMVL